MVNLIKTLDTNDYESYNTNNSSSSKDTGSLKSFDSYLQKSTVSNSKTSSSSSSDSSVKADTSNNYNSSSNCDNTKKSSDTDNMQSKDAASDKDKVKSDASDVEAKDDNSSKKLDDILNEADEIAKKLKSGDDVDLSQIMSLILKMGTDGGLLDLGKLKGELEKLKVPKDLQNDITDLVSKLQDFMNGKGSSDLIKALSAKINTTVDQGQHSQLIDEIVKVLKEKVNKTEDETSSKLSKDAGANNAAYVINKKSAAEVKEDNSDKNPQNGNSNLTNKFQDTKEENSETYSSKITSEGDSNLSTKDSSPKVDASKADKFLNKLTSNKSDNGFSKVTTLMNQLYQSNTADKVTAKAELPTINQNTFAQDIIKSVRYMQANDMQELTVKINPKELGEVVIRLSMENNIMKASLSTANKETYTLLSAHLEDINNSLNNQNMKIQNFSVNIYDDTTFFSGNNSNDGNSNYEEGNDKKDANKSNTLLGADNSDIDAGVSTSNLNILA